MFIEINKFLNFFGIINFIDLKYFNIQKVKERFVKKE